MSYDIFFVRRDPGQTFQDALDDLEGSYEGGDPGPLSEADLELWDAVLPRALDVLGPSAEVESVGSETRELCDPVSGIGLTFFQGEFEIHVPELGSGGSAGSAGSAMASADGLDEVEIMSRVYALAHAVEEATGLEGYDPQLGEPVSDTSHSSSTPRGRAVAAATDDDEDADRPRSSHSASFARPPVRRDSARLGEPAPSGRRWWEFWKP